MRRDCPATVESESVRAAANKVDITVSWIRALKRSRSTSFAAAARGSGGRSVGTRDGGVKGLPGAKCDNRCCNKNCAEHQRSTEIRNQKIEQGCFADGVIDQLDERDSHPEV